MPAIELHAVVHREEREYVARCLNVDLASCGATEIEALVNLKQAVELYLEGASLRDISPVAAPVVRRVIVQTR